MDELIRRAPEVIQEAAKSPLGLFALMILVLAVLAFFFFREASERTRVAIFALMFCGVAAFGYAILRVIPDNLHQVCYEDMESVTNAHNIRFLQLTARCTHNPPRVNDEVSVEFTIQNVGNKPIAILETWVAAYDPKNREKDFGHSNKRRIIKPEETIKTFGRRVVDVPGIWYFGPDYALGEKWDGEKYPGQWKRFTLLVQ